MLSPLVDCDWLESRLANPDLRIIDIRGQVLPATEPPPHYFSHRQDYDQAHIPGAHFVDWQIDIVEPGSPSNDIAPPSRFARLMGSLGIDERVTVVIYDDAASMFAARLRWCLRFYGHERVRILDGGWQAWIAGERPVTADVPSVAPRTFTPRVNGNLRADAAQILGSLGQAGRQLLDVRSLAEYSGEASRAQFAGHIPGAINLPRSVMVADDLRLKSPADLRQSFADLGIQLDAEETVLYCNSGVSASYGMLAMEVAGAGNLRVYDGSWKEWGNDAGKPIAR